MFSQVPVILSKGGVSQHALGRGVCGQTPPRQTSPWADTPRADTSPGRHPLPSACWDTTLPSACWDTCTPPRRPLQRTDSYWNAFLFFLFTVIEKFCARLQGN